MRLRILSALVLGPPVFAAIYVGSHWFDAVVVIAGLLMSWEWARLCCDGEYSFPGWLLTAVIAGAMAATMAGTPLLGIAVVAIATVILVIVGRMEGGGSAGYLGFGVVLIGIFTVSFLWIRDFTE